LSACGAGCQGWAGRRSVGAVDLTGRRHFRHDPSFPRSAGSCRSGSGWQRRRSSQRLHRDRRSAVPRSSIPRTIDPRNHLSSTEPAGCTRGAALLRLKHLATRATRARSVPRPAWWRARCLLQPCALSPRRSCRFVSGDNIEPPAGV
jgi:hypothetical protein